MRIIAGQWRGRRLQAPDDDRIRPTGDRVREAWMSIVRQHIPDALVLDLFAGTGALGLEALSRGAAKVVFVEQAAPSLALLRANVAGLGADDAVEIRRADAMKFVADLPAGAFDLAFADPPYDQGLATALAQAWLARPFAAVLGIEHRRRERLPEPGDARRYGDTVITFYGLHGEVLTSPPTEPESP